MAQARCSALRRLNDLLPEIDDRDDRSKMLVSAVSAPVVVALLVATGAFAPSSRAASACAGVPAAVEGANAEEVAIACDGARAAFAFFAPLHLVPAPGQAIEVVAALPAELPGDAVGAYLSTSRRILVLRYEAFTSHGGWFGLPADTRLYRAVIAHEVAHAIASWHAGETRLPSAAQEYVAHVAMIATMYEDHRRELLALHPGSGFDDLAQINELVYAFQPARFAVDSYRHWMQQPDRAAFLRRVLDGELIPGARP